MQRKRAHTRAHDDKRTHEREGDTPACATHAGSHLAGTGPGTGSEIHAGQTLARRARWTTLKPLAPRDMSNRRSRRLTSGCPQTKPLPGVKTPFEGTDTTVWPSPVKVYCDS